MEQKMDCALETDVTLKVKFGNSPEMAKRVLKMKYNPKMRL